MRAGLKMCNYFYLQAWYAESIYNYSCYRGTFFFECKLQPVMLVLSLLVKSRKGTGRTVMNTSATDIGHVYD